MVKEEQIKVLQKAILRLEVFNCIGLCSAIRRSLNNLSIDTSGPIPDYIPGFTFDHISHLCMLYNLPLPVFGTLTFWWHHVDDRATRIKVLNLLIEELK